MEPKLIFCEPGYTPLVFDGVCYQYRVALKERREQRGLTVAQLANRCNVSDQAIYNIENGINDPSLSLLIRLCCVLDIYIYQLLDICLIDHQQDLARITHIVI